MAHPSDFLFIGCTMLSSLKARLIAIAVSIVVLAMLAVAIANFHHALQYPGRARHADAAVVAQPYGHRRMAAF
jgi:hypothetical protein